MPDQATMVVDHGNGAAVAGLVSGAAVYSAADGARAYADELHTVAISLIAIGGVSAVLSLITPLIGDEPVQRPEQARRACRGYNATLRAELGLTEGDIAAIDRRAGKYRPVSKATR